MHVPQSYNALSYCAAAAALFCSVLVHGSALPFSSLDSLRAVLLVMCHILTLSSPRLSLCGVDSASRDTNSGSNERAQHTARAAACLLPSHTHMHCCSDCSAAQSVLHSASQPYRRSHTLQHCLRVAYTAYSLFASRRVAH